jgi:hypothetical protein
MFFGLNDVAFLGSLQPPAPAFDFLDPANIGLPVEGGYFAGLISHTADGNPTHALIVAPAATGASGGGYTLTTNLQWKTTNTITAGADSSFDGAANTAAMVAAGIDDHPVAKFCVDLSIGGFTDWYAPARFELDIAYFHLKPSITANSTSSGINDYSVPKRTVNYTTGSPALTSVTVFQGGQPEAFVGGNHWTSTENSATNAWRHSFNTGLQDVFSKIDTAFVRVRAFRQIAL